MTTPTISYERLQEIIKEEISKLSEAAFSQGDIVRSTVDAQGLKKGKKYEVVGDKTTTRSFGDFVTYVLRDLETGKELNVANARALLDKVGGIREAVDHKGINGIVSVASKLLAAV